MQLVPGEPASPDCIGGGPGAGTSLGDEIARIAAPCVTPVGCRQGPNEAGCTGHSQLARKPAIALRPAGVCSDRYGALLNAVMPFTGVNEGPRDLLGRIRKTGLHFCTQRQLTGLNLQKIVCPLTGYLPGDGRGGRDPRRWTPVRPEGPPASPRRSGRAGIALISLNFSKNPLPVQAQALQGLHRPKPGAEVPFRGLCRGCGGMSFRQLPRSRACLARSSAARPQRRRTRRARSGSSTMVSQRPPGTACS